MEKKFRICDATPDGNKEKPKEILKVERGRLMHTGNFYEVFTGKRKVADMRGLYLGVSENDNPESNASIYTYSGGWHSWEGQYGAYKDTAVYKKDYLNRIKVFKHPNGGIVQPRVPQRWLDNPDEHLEPISLEEIDRLFESGVIGGEDGIPTLPQSVYNPEEIEAIICYSDEDVKAMAELVANKEDLKHISIYTEVMTQDAKDLLIANGLSPEKSSLKKIDTDLRYEFRKKYGGFFRFEKVR